MQDRYRHLVDGVLWYGAVDIDTQHLVIWVLLKGPESTLPEWYFPYGEYRPAGIDNELLSSIQAIRTAILECFRDEWPNADRISIGFDSAERVDRLGGFQYFR